MNTIKINKKETLLKKLEKDLRALERNHRKEIKTYKNAGKKLPSKQVVSYQATKTSLLKQITKITLLLDNVENQVEAIPEEPKRNPLLDIPFENLTTEQFEEIEAENRKNIVDIAENLGISALLLISNYGVEDFTQTELEAMLEIFTRQNREYYFREKFWEFWKHTSKEFQERFPKKPYIK